MCGRYGGPREAEVHAGFLDVTSPFSLLSPPRDYRPTDLAPVYVKNREGQIVLKEMRWWFVPATYTGALKDWKATTFNARLEEVATKPTFKRAWDLRHRVIVPAGHYYEWTGPAGAKTQWQVRPSGHQPLAFAGLWDHAQTEEGSVLSFAILTREPGPAMQRLHPREPVVIEPHDWQAWLDGADVPCLSQPWDERAFTVQAA
ncbi:SOS response-associated peptidase [Asticcacaulis sp. YBE204]|uniref:SOS response-associated peptidase n=1 Tax=Asticcacaulis sp. YBE204 TaxID=1282363 RepID=UPI0009DF1F11|nr:SOS response-associated peptidase [Asticcacaulis sp. YBE204]